MKFSIIDINAKVNPRIVNFYTTVVFILIHPYPNKERKHIKKKR